MGLYSGNSAWIDDVYQFEETDVVIGGPDGVDNKPLKDLADRTQWLKSQIGRMNRIEDEIVLTTSGPIANTLAGHLITAFAAGGNISLFLDDPHGFPHGAIIPIAAFANPGYLVSVVANGFPFLNPVDGVVPVMNMHHNEQLLIVALTDHWKVINAHGNFYCAGEEVKSRKRLLNTLALQGQLVDRAAYPRLWAFAQSLVMYQEIIDENSWWNNGLTYRGLFTIGDGATNFRLPDERGMHERMLDLGRGVDLSRTHNFAGGYEADEVKQHGHTLSTTNTPSSSNNFADPMRGQIGGSPNAKGAIGGGSIGLTGGPENTVKNIGKLHLIKY